MNWRRHKEIIKLGKKILTNPSKFSKKSFNIKEPLALLLVEMMIFLFFTFFSKMFTKTKFYIVSSWPN